METKPRLVNEMLDITKDVSYGEIDSLYLR